ncbi:hypothetical protein NDU88_001102 [Pleurodeles waltl]|uniref:Uncharacterized protein n=1 Tax=Pleurodeles waltl TaxID=8319 RepID=A0AAV7TJ53_PLEWA|nr:hypothetical protein NDU88_001102 [Pleurodeles waltl]
MQPRATRHDDAGIARQTPTKARSKYTLNKSPDLPAIVVLLSERGTSSGSRGLSRTYWPVAGSSTDSQAPPLGPHRVLTERPCLEPPGTASVALRLLRPQ